LVGKNGLSETKWQKFFPQILKSDSVSERFNAIF